MSTVHDPTATPSPRSGARVAGRYELLEAIGAGGAGTVYRARDHVLGRDVAMKVFRGEALVTDDLIRQEREIRLLSGLEHPGLISVHDAGKQNFDGMVQRFIVMELVDDATLEQRMANAPLPPLEVAAIGAHIADALAYVHSKGIVHRDVKPGNILINDTSSSGFRRTAKLGDFGIAQYVQATRLTSDGTVLGTAGYLSPEQVSGGAVGVSSDVYSLGLVLLEALTGVFEYPGTPVESAVARTSRDPRVPEELPEEWRLLLTAMTSRDPADRPTASEVAGVLHGRPDEALTGSGRRSATRAHRRASFATLRARRRRNVMLTTAAIGLALTACVLSFWLGLLVAS